MVINKKQNPLQVNVGDQVEIHLPHMSGPRAFPFLATVTSVTDRTHFGQDAGIDYTPEEGSRDLEAERLGIPYGCSVSYVTRVVRRSGEWTSPPKVNLYRECSLDPLCKKYGGVVASYDVKYLFWVALSTAQGDISRPLDEESFVAMWHRDGCRGRVGIPTRIGNSFHFMDKPPVAVRWKTFKRYVLKNVNRLKVPKTVIEREGKKTHDQIWEEEPDMNDDFERW
jgi:hypothetical protein